MPRVCWQAKPDDGSMMQPVAINNEVPDGGATGSRPGERVMEPLDNRAVVDEEFPDVSAVAETTRE